jgi:hypothetical protein
MRKLWLSGLVLWSALVVAAPLPALPKPGEAADSPTAPVVKAFTGKITAVDAKAATITLRNRLGQSRSFTIPTAAKIQINGNAASFTELTTEMYGGVIMDSKYTPVEVRAYLPKPAG